MYERCLNEAERILAADRDIIVPVKKVWMEVKKQGHKQKFDVPTLVDLTVMMEADNRFEFMPTPRNEGGDMNRAGVDEEDADDADLESLGFYSGDRVKLRRVQLSPELIGDVIRRKVDMTMIALSKAWEMRPKDDMETEDQLLEILSKTQKLQREIKEHFSEEKMKTLRQSLGKKAKAPLKPSRKVGAKARTLKSSKKRSLSIKRGTGKTKRGRRK